MRLNYVRVYLKEFLLLANFETPNLLLVTSPKEREESTQNTTVANSAAYASYKIKAAT
jgi:hypothetical protein